MTVYIVGKNGYIASRLAVEGHLPHPTFLSTSPEREDIPFNLQKAGEFDYNRFTTGDVIILLAAVSSPDVCRTHYADAFATNVTGTIRFAQSAMACGAKVLFFSSDTVLGEGVGFDESSPCNPVGEYGKMKHWVETHFAGEPLFKVFRLSYVYSAQDKFSQYLVSCVRGGSAADIFHPFNRRVIYLQDVIDAIVAVCNDWDACPAGLVNLAGPELLSRVDLANLYRKHIAPTLRFSVTEPDASFFEARPRVIDMHSKYLESILGRPPLTIGEAMSFESNKQLQGA